MEKSYELCVLFAGTQTPAEIENLSGQIEALVAATKADIKFAYSLGRKKLAYQIKNNSHGEYRCWLFSVDSTAIPVLTEKLRLSPIIIRHLLTILESDLLAKRLQKAQDIKAGKVREIPEDRRDEETPAEAPKVKKIEAKEEVAEEAPAPKDKPKLSLEDLDKKLDEILDSDKI